MKRCKYITCWTDYPFNGAPHKGAPIRHVQVLCYDGSKYATVQDLATGEIEQVRAGYLYRKPERWKMVQWNTGVVFKGRAVGWSAYCGSAPYWVQRPKGINPRKLERMIQHFVD